MAGYALPEIDEPPAAGGAMKLRPRSGALIAIAALCLVGIILVGFGLILGTSGSFIASGAFAVLGIPLALLPPAYFLRARVTLDDRILVKYGLIRKIGWCPPNGLASIQTYTTRWGGSRFTNDSIESHGYAFLLEDGTPIFKLSYTWWSVDDIAELGRRVGLEGTLGGPSAEGMTRPLSAKTAATAHAAYSEYAKPDPVKTTVIVLLVLLVILAILLGPLITGKLYS